jgi:uncharacterized coiled-coil protein SlyX
MSAFGNERDDFAMLIAEQNKVIDELQRKLTKTEERCERITDVVYQLIGGLFNQGTQKTTLIGHVNSLLGHEFREEDGSLRNTCGWGNLPTTRQGDVLESRVNDLTCKIDALLADTPSREDLDQLDYRITNLHQLRQKTELKMDAIHERISTLQHQLVCDLTQHKASSTKDIEKLDEHIREVSNDVVDITHAMREMGSGLYNMDTQRGAWKDVRSLFFKDGTIESMNEKQLSSWSTTTSKWGALPTTRQGDECEERLDKIEAMMQMMKKALSGTEDK